MSRFAISNCLRNDPVNGDGWIELGQDDFSRSTVRILDIRGLIRESDQRFGTVAQALEAVERALAEWINENLSRIRG